VLKQGGVRIRVSNYRGDVFARVDVGTRPDERFIQRFSYPTASHEIDRERVEQIRVRRRCALAAEITHSFCTKSGNRRVCCQETVSRQTRQSSDDPACQSHRAESHVDRTGGAIIFRRSSAISPRASVNHFYFVRVVTIAGQWW